MKYLMITTLLALSFKAKATEIQWQENGTCILTEQRLYDDSADYPKDFKSAGYIQGGMDYYLYDLVTVPSGRSTAEMTLKGSLTYNESLRLQVYLPRDKGSLASMSISVKSNPNKFLYNTDVFAKGDEFLNEFSEQFSNAKYPELTANNIRQFMRNLRTRSLLPRQVDLLHLEEKISAALEKKKQFYVGSLVVFNNRFAEILNAPFNDLVDKYGGTLLGASVTCYFEEK